MKVLLLGEFSDLHRYLRDGLRELGETVHLASNGDTMCHWKGLTGADSDLYPSSGKGLKRTLDECVMPFFFSKRLQGYDVVQLINPRIYKGIINCSLIERIVERNGVLSLSASGNDSILYKAYKKNAFEYFTFDGDAESDHLYNSDGVSHNMLLNYENRLIKKADIIIPCSYDYYKAYTLFDEFKAKTNQIIPLPINCDEFVYQDNIVHEKVVFFHGINREISKGSCYIIQAMKRLQDRYPNDVKIIINKRMPYMDYINAMQEANVVLDQCKSYGYGMNACIAMAQGKVVMSGNHPETIAYDNTISPVIWIKPDVDWIYNKMVDLLDNKSKLMDLGALGRSFVESHHDYREIASKYLDAWKKINS